MRSLIILVCLAGVAVADDEIARGTVVKVEAKEIYVSLGSDRGVGNGAALRIKRPIALRHPVTRAQIDDWIPIGSASVTQAGAEMSRAVVGELVADIKVGDVAEVLIDRPDAERPAPVMAAVDPATAEVLGVFAAQAGQSLDVRIASWERYLSMRAMSPYGEAVRRDLDVLRALRDQMRPRSGAQNAETIATVAHSAPKSAPADVAIPVVFVLDAPERVASAYLHYRPRGAPTYRSVLLAREHDIYLRGAVPAEAVRAPGVDYFVEVSTPNGRAGLALATPADPIQVEVAGPPLVDQFAPVPGRSSVKLSSDYLDFGTFDRRSGDHTDRMVTANVDFTYKLASFVESVGVGAGVYAGAGGYANAVWTPDNPLPESGFQYGYGDVEVGGHVDHVHLSVGGQLIAGVGKAGFGMGAEGRFRIGERDGLNLLLSARTVDQVGAISEVRLGTRPLSKVLVGVSVAATNQPNDGDIGVKLGTDVEILAIRNISLLLRGSWQGRTIDHGGLGGGGGVGFTW